MVCLQIPLDGSQPPAQFLPVASIAPVAETAEPTFSCERGSDNGAGTDDLPTFAPGVARSAGLVQAALWCRQFFCLWQSTLPGGLPRPIEVYDHVGVSCSINQLTDVSLFVQRAREQIGEKERTERFCGLKADARQKARERRAGGQFLAVEQRHERLLPGLHRLIEGFQGAFAADCVADQHRHKVDDFVASEAAAGKANSLRDGVEDSPLCAGVQP